MNRTKTLKGHCTHCNGLLEFPAESTGLTMDCPLCGEPTELLLARPVEEPTIPRATLVWTAIAILVLAGGLAAALGALKRAERLAAKKVQASAAKVSTNVQSTNEPPPASPATANGLFTSAVVLEKVPGSSLVYAIGTVTNTSARQRFGIKVELELVNAEGRKVGTASDYQAVLEPMGTWQFKALVVDPKATASARVTSIQEQQ